MHRIQVSNQFYLFCLGLRLSMVSAAVCVVIGAVVRLFVFTPPLATWYCSRKKKRILYLAELFCLPIFKAHSHRAVLQRSWWTSANGGVSCHLCSLVSGVPAHHGHSHVFRFCRARSVPFFYSRLYTNYKNKLKLCNICEILFSARPFI